MHHRFFPLAHLFVDGFTTAGQDFYGLDFQFQISIVPLRRWLPREGIQNLFQFLEGSLVLPS